MEKTITQFMNAWISRNYKKMYELSQQTWKSRNGISMLKTILTARIKKYEILEIKMDEKLPCICDVTIKVRNKGKLKKLNARMIKEDGVRKPSEEGTWGVNPISLVKNLYM